MWQVFKELDWSSIIRPEMHHPVGRLSESLSGIPVVEVPGSIPVRSKFGLCGGYSTLGSNTRDISGNYFRVSLASELQLFSIRQVSSTANRREACTKKEPSESDDRNLRIVIKNNKVAKSFFTEADSGSGQLYKYTTSPGSLGTIGRCACYLAYLPTTLLSAVARPRSATKTAARAAIRSIAPASWFEEFLTAFTYSTNREIASFPSYHSCFACSNRGHATADKNIALHIKRLFLFEDE